MDKTLQQFALHRLYHQQISNKQFATPDSLVSYMGAMQAQDYEMAKWGIALRLDNAGESSIEHAVNTGSIIRSHILRPTWHFVSATDYRWMLDLSAPQLQKNANTYNKQVGLDELTLKKSYKLIAKLLRNHEHLTRDEIMLRLQKEGIETTNLRSTHIMFHAELNGLVCNGIRKGKQLTYALLDERVPHQKPITKEEALCKLALRYFTSHAPATERDFSWWSGLNLGDVRKAIAMLQNQLNRIQYQNQIYYFTQSDLYTKATKDNVGLLPAFDELLVGYADRTAHLDDVRTREIITVNGIFKPAILYKGKVTGYWKRTVKPKSVDVEIVFFDTVKRDLKQTIQKAFNQFADYLNQPTINFIE